MLPADRTALVATLRNHANLQEPIASRAKGIQELIAALRAAADEIETPTGNT